MATIYVDGSAATNGSGTELSPYNAVPSNTLTGSNTWLFKRGSILNMGSSLLSSGNSVVMGAYGSGARPVITGTSNLWSCSTANSVITINDIHFLNSGGGAATGVNASRMSGGSARFTMQDCIIEGCSTGFNGDRSLRVTLERNQFIGASNHFAIYGRADSNENCDDWTVAANEFAIGSSLFFASSTSTTLTGAVNNLVIRGNKFSGDTSNTINLGCPTSQANSNLYLRVTAPSTVEAFTDAGGTVPSNLPAWAAGKKVFFAGFSNRANFGLFTVTSVTTNTLVVTETSLATEALGQNKGIHTRDTDRAFNGLLIEDNDIATPGATPMNLNGIVGGIIRRNTITGGTGVGKVSAGIELINVLRGAVYGNVINGLTVNGGVQTVDGMGIMIDGASEDCIAYGNRISGLSGLPGVANSGAGIALFESKNCRMFSNVVTDSKKGAWVGGPGTTGSLRNNTLARCDQGIEVNSSPAAGVIAVTNNLLADNDTIGTPTAAATSANNWFWRNTAGSAFGTASQTSDPLVTDDYRPKPGSPLLTGGADIGYMRDVGGRQGKKFVGAYTAASLVR